MNSADSKQLEDVRAGVAAPARAGTRYKADVEFLLRLLDESRARGEKMRGILNGLVHIPAVRQALGTNHVGDCTCFMCRARAALRDEQGEADE